MSTKIAWCDETWNPVIGCSKKSAGCENCYAERMAFRLGGMERHKWTYGRVVNHCGDHEWRIQWNGHTVFIESALEKPLHWKKPRTIFVCSMGDLFHETVPFEWIDRIFGIIDDVRAKREAEYLPNHKWMLLTKRPARALEYFTGGSQYTFWTGVGDCTGKEIPIGHVDIGVTVEDQKAADERIPILLKIPAAKRFISFEPLLSPIVFPYAVSRPDYAFIGCESGPGARLCDINWIKLLRNRCGLAHIPVGIKQIPLNGKCSKFEDRDQWPPDLRVWEIEK